MLVDGHTPDAWADALEQLLIDDSTRLTMATSAVKRAAAFSWAASAAALSDVYAEVLEGFTPMDHRDATGE